MTLSAPFFPGRNQGTRGTPWERPPSARGRELRISAAEGQRAREEPYKEASLDLPQVAAALRPLPSLV